MAAGRVWRGFAVLVCALPLLASLLLPPGQAASVRAVTMAVTAPVVLVAVGVGAWRQRGARGPLGPIFVASLSWVVGELLSAAYPPDSAAGWVGIVLNLVGFGSVVFGLTRVGRIHEHHSEPDSWADSAVLVLVCALAAWWLVAVLGIGAPEHSDAATVRRWAILVGDIVLLGACLRLITIVSLRALGIRFVMLAAVLLVLGDVVALWGPVERAQAPVAAILLWLTSWVAFGQFALDPSSAVLLTPAPRDD